MPARSRPRSAPRSADWLAKQHADAAVLSALDSIAWAFNVRGAGRRRIRRSRLPIALVNADGTADLFVAAREDRRRRPPASRQRRAAARARGVRAALSRLRTARPSRSIPSARSRRSSKRSKRPGPRSCRCAIRRSCPRRSRTRPRSPARKPPRRATARRFPGSSNGSTIEAPKGEVDELNASRPARGSAPRECPSFATCRSTPSPGAGPNGAIVHYRSSEKTNRKLESGHALSGRFGRPICRRHHRHHPHRRRSASRPTKCATASPACSRAISRSRPRSSPRARAAASSTASRAGRCGRPGSIMRTAPAMASAASSRSTKGRSEFRRSEARQAGGDEPLQAGMILSNEPGYYKTGEYGIRIENLVLVVAKRDRRRREGNARLRDADVRADRPATGRSSDMLEPDETGLAQLLSRPGAGAKIGPSLSGDGSRLAPGGLRGDLGGRQVQAQIAVRFSDPPRARRAKPWTSRSSPGMEWYDGYIERHADDLDEGRIVSALSVRGELDELGDPSRRATKSSAASRAT